MAHKKGVGSTDNGRDSNSKRLGVKLFGGQFAKAGNIIVRQRGTKFHPGLNVGIGKDHTLFALTEGTITFQKRRKNRTFVNVIKEADVSPVVVKTATKPKAASVPKTVEPKPTRKEETVPEVKSTSAPAKAKTAKPDNLKKIEGIGPKTSELLIQAGISSFSDLASTEVARIQEILDAAGSRYKIINPTTWPEQASLAAEGKWDELAKLQGSLKGGKA